MNDKSALLGQLKIDRGSALPQRRRPWGWFFAVAVLAAAGAAWWLWPEAAVPVRAAVAQALTAASGPGSVLDASGYVVARRQATVSSKVTGKVMELNIEEGQRVRQNDVLARLDDANARAHMALTQSQLDAARAGQEEIRVQMIEAERQLRRSRELHERGLVSDAALDNSQANVDSLKARLDSAIRNVEVAGRSLAVQRQLLNDTVVRAPFDGVITVKNAQIGEMISPLSAGGAGTRTGIGTLVDMDSLEIEVDVNENFINRVQPGQPVEARLNAYPDLKIPCEVIAVIPAADRSKATVKVRIGIKQGDPRILPDMGARVSFLNGEARAAGAEAPRGVLIPAAAVKDDGGTKVVFVLKGDTVERRAVSVAGTRGERVALGDLSKLAEGVKVSVQE